MDFEVMVLGPQDDERREHDMVDECRDEMNPERKLKETGRLSW